MDHQPMPLPCLSRGLPRLRGDGPQSATESLDVRWATPPTRGWTPTIPGLTLADEGYPAYAGMDPGWSAADPVRARLPRLRGDGPSFSPSPGDTIGATPPTRGWTPSLRRGHGRCGGYPAYAGMDLIMRAEGQLGIGLPRLRGDGPGHWATCKTRPQATPPTRGWTQC